VDDVDSGGGVPEASDLPGRALAARALQLLLDRGAEAVQHLNGHLLDHLQRTERLLADWGAPEALSIAGLCHACYGTDGFTLALLGPDEREVLTNAVGPEVERIVYFYASCDRDFLYPQIGLRGPTTFRDRFTGEVLTPSGEQLRAFVDLTLANEADVAIVSTPSADVPDWFITLVRQFGPLASGPAAIGCERLTAPSSSPASPASSRDGRTG
jgi:hypothetical protein